MYTRSEAMSNFSSSKNLDLFYTWNRFFFCISKYFMILLKDIFLVLVTKKFSKSKRRAEDTVEEYRNDAQMLKLKKIQGNDKGVLEIDDLNDDCLQCIFACLHMDDLVNVADTSKRFNQLTKLVFKCRYAKRRAHIEFDLSVNLKMMRSFGELIKKIEIHFDVVYEIPLNRYIINPKLEQYIIKYCFQSDSLRELYLFDCPANAFNTMEMPFKNVETLHIIDGYLMHGKLSHFNQWFPKMRHLNVSYSEYEMINLKCFEIKFSLLEHLNVKFANRQSFYTKTSTDFAILLNPQLRSIHYDRK